jgi:hypothetical protein
MARIDVTALRRNSRPWQPAAGRMAVTTHGVFSTNLFVGQDVEITGVAGPPRIATAEGMFDYRAYLRQQGIYYICHEQLVIVGQLLAQPEKLLCAGDGIGHCVVPVDHDRCGRIRGPDYR